MALTVQQYTAAEPMHVSGPPLAGSFRESSRLLVLKYLATTVELIFSYPENSLAIDVDSNIKYLHGTLDAFSEELTYSIAPNDLEILKAVSKKFQRLAELEVSLDLLAGFGDSGTDEKLFLCNEIVDRISKKTRKIKDILESSEYTEHLSSLRDSLSTYLVLHEVGSRTEDPTFEHILFKKVDSITADLIEIAGPFTDDIPVIEPRKIERIIFQILALTAPWKSDGPDTCALFERLNNCTVNLRCLRALNRLQLAKTSRIEEWAKNKAEYLCKEIQQDLHLISELLSTYISSRTYSPNGMIEIERKYLLSSIPDVVSRDNGVRIAQGWLPGKILRERFRRSIFPDGSVQWTRTIKLGKGISRVEIEEQTDPVLFESLWPFTSGARVEKVRYPIRDGLFTWEIDVFLDRDLVLAEIELPSESAEFEIPEWLSSFIVREVTGEDEYVNINLAIDRRGVSNIYRHSP